MSDVSKFNLPCLLGIIVAKTVISVTIHEINTQK